MDAFQRMIQWISQQWAQMNAGMRVGVAVVGFGMLAMLGWVASNYLGEATYEPLFVGSVQEAGAVKAKLDSLAVDYRASNGGSTISVPPNMVDKLKMELAVAGLPMSVNTGKGYELLDSESMLGRSPFRQSVDFKRATEGELARVITSLDSVDHAKVLIAMPNPEDRLFVRDEKPATASVVLRTRGTMNRQKVAGIVALVASSVEGLEESNVTVHDSKGVQLSEQSDPNSNVSNSQWQMQREFESHLELKAQQVLSPVLGFGHSVVRVAADMDFSREKKQSTTYDPEAKAIETSKTKTSKDTTGTTGGPVGTVSNVPPLAPAQAQNTSGSGSSSEEETEETYLVSENQLSSEQMRKIVNRLTVAVTVMPPDEAGLGEEEADLSTLLSMEPQTVANLVRDAVGFDEGRGDKITVAVGKRMPLDGGSLPTSELEQQVQSYVQLIKRNPEIVAALGWLFGIIFGIFFYRKIATAIRKKAAERAEAAKKAAASQSHSQEEMENLEAIADTLKTWIEA